ncbi:hypothetical protein Tco_0517953 [Tanacetum coccineum]
MITIRLYNDDIDSLEALPPDFELVSLEVLEIFISEVGGIVTDILLTTKTMIARILKPLMLAVYVIRSLEL